MARIKGKEAGGVKVKRRKPSIGEKPIKSELNRLYIKESKSIRSIANELNRSPDTIHRWIKGHGIPTRSSTRKSQLLNISLDEIERKVKELGIRGYARELGLTEGTIRHHLKIRRN